MTESNNDPGAAFDRIVHEYYQAVEKGERVDSKVFIDQYPEFKDELKSFFADLKNLGAFPDDAAEPGTVELEATQMPGANAAPVRPGDSLTYIGEYRVLGEIARGGMGVVFKAKQETLGRTVALKMILAGRLASSVEVERFRREARAAAALKHPNIVGVHEISVHDGHHYFTMDYIESESLSHRLRKGSLAPRQAAELLDVLARATHYAHGQGVLHRDLKPANILIDLNGHPHITDFGLAKPIAEVGESTQEEITTSGQIIGTPSYMAPEQAAAKHQLVSVASDVYSLGAILYACLSGRAPFVAESTVETLRQVVHDDPLPTRVLNPRVPKDLETICLKCLSKEPRHRYYTAEELADDLSRFLEGRPVMARPVNAMVKTWRMARRNPWAAAAISLLALIAVVSPPVAIHQFWQSKELAAKADRITNQIDQISGLLSAKEEMLQRAITAEGNATESAKLAQTEALRNRRLLYVSDMQRMDGLYDQANIRAMREMLTRHIPATNTQDFRDFEWYYWLNKCDSQLTSWSHDGSVKAVEVSPSGRWAASYHHAGEGTTVQINDAQTGDLEKTIELSKMRVLDLQFRNDRELLVAGQEQLVAGQGQQDVVQLLHWQSPDLVEQPILSFPAARQQPTSRYAISKTTNLVARSFMGNVTCYDANTGKSLEIRVPEDADTKLFRQRGVVYADPKGRYIKFGGRVSGATRFRFGNTVQQVGPFDGAAFPQVWETGNEFTPSVEDDGGPVFSTTFSTAEDLLAVGTRDGRIKIWDLSSGEEVLDFPAHQGAVRDLDFSTDDRSLVSVGDDGLVRAWSILGGTLQAELGGEGGAVHSVAVGRNGLIVTGNADHMARVWRLPSNKPVGTFRGNEDRVNSVRLSPNQRSFYAAGEDGRVRQWPVSAPNNAIVVADASPFYGVDLSADQSTAAACGLRKGVTVWDLQSGGKRFYTDETSMYPIFHVKIAGDTLWALRWDGSLLRWDLATGQRQVQKKYSVDLLSPMLNAAISPDGQRVAVQEKNGQVKIDSITSDGVDSVTLATIFESSVSIAFSPDGSKLITHILRSRDEKNADKVSLQLWNSQSGELVADVARGPTYHGTLSANGDRLAYHEYTIANPTNLQRDQALVIWDPADQKRVARIPQEGVTSLAISPDGTKVALIVPTADAEGDSDTRVSVRRIPDGGELYSLAIPSKKIAFTSDGSQLIVIANTGSIALVDAESGRIASRLVNSAGRITSVDYSPRKPDLAATFTNRSSFGQTVISRDNPDVQQLKLTPNNIRGSRKTAIVYLPDGLLTYQGLVWQRCDLEPAVKEQHKISQKTGYLQEAIASSAGICFFMAPDRTLFRFELADGKHYTHTALPLHGDGACLAMTTTMDGRFVAIAFADEIRVYDGTNLRELKSIGEIDGATRVLSLNDDGSLLAAGGTDGIVHLWNAADWRLQSLVSSHSGPITCIRFSPQGQTIVSASEDGAIHLSDVLTGAPKTTFDDHEGAVHWIAFSPQGDELASAGDDGTIRLWKAPGVSSP